MKKILVFLASMILVLAFAGCGAGGTGAAEQGGQAPEAQAPEAQTQEDTGGEQPAAAIIEPEQIVTLQEASAIMGMDLKMGERTDNEVVGQKLCVYDAADPEDFTSFQVSVNQLAYLPPEQVEYGNAPENIYKTTKDNFADTLEPVAGIGDDAFIDTPGLHLLYRGYYVVIALGNSDDPVNIERLKDAGQKAVANLDALLD